MSQAPESANDEAAGGAVSIAPGVVLAEAASTAEQAGPRRESTAARTAAVMSDIERQIVRGLGRRSLVLVGLMGCGKTSVGRRLAQRLGLGFVDADEEIERAANKSIPEIFAEHGEPYFRDGERRVIARLLRAGPQVLATGGGAFMNDETRDAIKATGLSVWLRAELPVLMKRVGRRTNRPLLKSPDPEGTMRRFIELRYPVYALADITVESRDVTHEVMAETVIRAIWDSGKV